MGHSHPLREICFGSLDPLKPWYPAEQCGSIQGVRRGSRVTNLSQHSVKTTLDTLIPHTINVRLMLALSVLRVGGVVYKIAWHTVCEFRDPPFHEMVDIIRNRPNADSLIPVQNNLYSLSSPRDRSLTCVRQACKTGTRGPTAAFVVVPSTTGSWQTHQRGTRSVFS